MGFANAARSAVVRASVFADLFVEISFMLVMIQRNAGTRPRV